MHPFVIYKAQVKMNKAEKALSELGAMDELASQDSFIHELSAAVKLPVTIVYIITVMSFGKYDLSRLMPMVLLPVLLFQISGIPVRTCFYKLRIVLPLVMAVGLFNPFFDRQVFFYMGRVPVTGGVISMITLMLKGIFCLMASFLLVATTPFDSICAALRQFRLPKILVTLLLLTYRYISVMAEEVAVMTDAYHLRAPGQKGIHISAWGSFLGQLLLRSMDRAQELYSSMLLRGYDHEFHYAPSRPFKKQDAVYILLCVLFCVLMRTVNIAQLLGNMIVR